MSSSQAPSQKRLVFFREVAIQDQLAGARINADPNLLYPVLSDQPYAINTIITCLAPEQRLPL